MITFPRQHGGECGWILDYKFIQEIKKIIESDPSSYNVGMEEIEMVLIAVEKFYADESN